MKSPYLLVSDLHFHAWSMFAGPPVNGVNARLQIIMDELHRAVTELVNAGGNHIVFAGDVFHQRGVIDPEVFNPVFNEIRSYAEAGYLLSFIPGNHDLKSRDTTEIGNAIQSFCGLGRDLAVVYTKPAISRDIVFIPWMANLGDLRKAVAEMWTLLHELARRREDYDLIIHAGINGAVVGPDNGLDAAEVAGWGFKRVFAGHYHNHKVFEDGKVIQIGATTQQSYKDIGTSAGFILVYPDRIDFRASHAPSFIELNETTDWDEVPLLVDGNYVRIRGLKMTDAEINGHRKTIMDCGAKGVSFEVARAAATARGGGSVAAKALSLESAVEGYIENLGLPFGIELKDLALDLLQQARETGAEA